ncbi:hypothetical protein NI389_13760 [Pseudoalteromonas xiamenensis]|uniref:hypothetical protein n=1 Tax=Pseudoalteromonas xiamenensis TaxID=882626 RepID=UPI0027E484BD|nr:hypothetical protein [Pseudoalteromonas xiamenensis]WMN59266.1 hypothetical protein NI389_13760 [Pseudoalteromonas xiamenensis]
MALEQDIANLIDASNNLTTIVDNKIQSIDARVKEAKTQVDGYINQVNGFINSQRAKQSHFRLTKNQALIPNADNSFPLHWSSGYVKSAKLVETVSTGVEANARSPLAREFLRAINSDTQYFAGSFNIWELEYQPNRGGEQKNLYAYLMYQYFRRPTEVTVGAIVKHIKGVVPNSYWCQGLKANEEAKLCGMYIGADSRNTYSHCHPYVAGEGRPETETGIIQVALPAVVTGDVPLDKAWGQFAYLGDADQAAFN